MDHRTLICCAAALLTLTACSSTEPSAAGAGPSVSGATSEVPAAAETSTSPSYDGPTIPDGDYRRVLDHGDKEKFGVTRSDRALEFAPDGTLTNTLRIRGYQWSQSANYNGGAPSTGSFATIEYDDDGRLVLTETCCGRTRYDWDLQGDELTLVMDLAFLAREHPELRVGSQEVRVAQLMSSGTYTRVG